MLSEMEKAKGAPGNQYTGPVTAVDRSKTLASMGISKPQSSRWQKLAAIPDADFEATFAEPERKPSTAGLIAAHQAKTAPPAPVIDVAPTPPPRTPDPKALWLWGRLLDFEREGILAADPSQLVDTMLDHMKDTVHELAPAVSAWLGKIKV